MTAASRHRAITGMQPLVLRHADRYGHKCNAIARAAAPCAAGTDRCRDFCRILHPPPHANEPYASAASGIGTQRGRTLNIFISYRRAESSGYSGRIYDRLRLALPDADVFMDVERIEPGANWRERLAERIRAADVVLVAIGEEWRTLTDAAGARRLDDPHDVTRWELESAVKQAKRIVPLLLDDAPPLREAELPEPIRALAHLQAIRIRHDAFEAGMDDLIARLTGRSLRDEADSMRARLRIERAKRWIVPAIALLAVLLAWTRLLDLLTLDTRIATWTLALADAVAPLTLDPDLVLVGIGPDVDARDPALRARLADAIAALARAGARRIVLDIHFHEPRTADAVLAQAMREARERGTQVFFSFVDANAGEPRAVPELAAAATAMGLACVGRRLGYAQTVAVAFDVRERAGGWQVSARPGLALLGAAGRSRITAIEPGAAELVLEAEAKAPRYRYSVLSNPLSGTQGCPAMTPATRTAELLVRLAPGDALRARRVAFADVLAGRIAAERFAAKTVVIGFETPGESFRAALGLARANVFGYELHANAINVLAAGRSPGFASPVTQALLAGLLATFGAALGVRYRRLAGARLFVLFAAFVVAYGAAAVALAAVEDVLLNSAYDVAAFGIALGLFRHLARRWLR
jgi:CHASE2 domain-containing sensor protein